MMVQQRFRDLRELDAKSLLGSSPMARFWALLTTGCSRIPDSHFSVHSGLGLWYHCWKGSRVGDMLLSRSRAVSSPQWVGHGTKHPWEFGKLSETSAEALAELEGCLAWM